MTTIAPRATPLLFALSFAVMMMVAAPAYAQQPFLPADQWAALRDTASGTAPYENLRLLTTLHRVPATPQFDQAAAFILSKAQEYGLQDVHEERYPIDGETRYGLMRSYLGWQVEYATLWQTGSEPALLADWSTDPIRLADYSHGADVETGLIDVGDGTRESDYEGKDVRGKIVLADGVLSSVQALAVLRMGAAGIVSDMPNQATAWSGLDTTLVRWGHLDARASRGFAFMVSRDAASALRARLATGAAVTLRARVKADVIASHWTVVTAVLPGSDPRAGEIIYGCHLDHERPGANDNGSGCVTILESARILSSLIREGRLPRPARTLRFLWGPEVEGTMAYLSMHPDIRRAMRASVFMDMVGGDPFKNKSVLHVTGTPWSLPTFVTDVGAIFAQTIRDAAIIYTEDGTHREEAVVEDRGAAPGTRNAFLVDETPYAEGSDHDDYDSSTIAIPSLYLRDWPDVYIHTDHDSLDRIDPTKLRRVALLGAAAGYTYAALDGSKTAALMPYLAERSERRLAMGLEGAGALLRDNVSRSVPATYEAHNLIAQMLRRETGALRSFVAFTGGDPTAATAAIDGLQRKAAALQAWIDQQGAGHAGSRLQGQVPAGGTRVPHRIGEFGPLTYQNDDVLVARLGAARVSRIQLFSDDSSRLTSAQQQRGSLYAYEIINFVDGRRTVAAIRDAVSAEFGPVPLETVVDYLDACNEAKVIAFP